ncbi:hypothetical protein ATANTOWER_031268 [Ataeniobius toweri]|uniref:Uncharacterized protein n=1 Tax=Ataeniobius toweri TaxID=208326 RepID=A0ABU7AHK5_9TELE|nr:hypothetical protein [Ataeniobius toweri]
MLFSYVTVVSYIPFQKYPDEWLKKNFIQKSETFCNLCLLLVQTMSAELVRVNREVLNFSFSSGVCEVQQKHQTQTDKLIFKFVWANFYWHAHTTCGCIKLCYTYRVEGDTGVDFLSCPIPLPQKNVLSHPNPRPA